MDLVQEQFKNFVLTQYVKDSEERRAKDIARMVAGKPLIHASSVGHPCMRYLYYSNNGTVPQHSDDTKVIFYRGRVMEPVVLDLLETLGWRVVARHYRFETDCLTCEIDGYRFREDPWDDKPMDSKVTSMSAPKSCDDLLTAEEFWSQCYFFQMQSYMGAMTDVDFRSILTKEFDLPKQRDDFMYETAIVYFNPLQFTPKDLLIPFVPDEYRKINEKAKTVIAHILNEDPPKRHETWQTCATCSYFHCCHPQEFTEGKPSVSQAPEHIEVMERRELLSAEMKGFNDIKKNYELNNGMIKAILGEHPALVIKSDSREWLLTRTASGALQVK